MHMSYLDQLDYKQNKIIEIMKKFANIDVSVIKNIVKTEQFYYRNKITLQVLKKVGLYKKESYELFNDMYLNIAKQSLVSFLKTQSTKHIIDNGDDNKKQETPPNNITLYIIIGVTLLLIIAGAVFFILRKHK